MNWLGDEGFANCKIHSKAVVPVDAACTLGFSRQRCGHGSCFGMNKRERRLSTVAARGQRRANGGPRGALVAGVELEWGSLARENVGQNAL